MIGGPAGVGSSMLFAHLRHSGARTADIVNTRAIVSVAWVAGPPLATFIIGWFGDQAILLAIAAVAVLNMATTAALLNAARSARPRPPRPPAPSSTADAGRGRLTRRSTGHRADHGRLHLVAGRQRDGDDDDDRLRHPDPWARRAVGGHRPRGGGRGRGARPAADGPAQCALLPPRPDRRRLRGRHRLLPGPGAGLRSGAADRAAAAERPGLRRDRGHRAAAVPADDPPTRPGHRSLPEHPSTGGHRVRADHRGRLPDRARPARHLRDLCRATLVGLVIIVIASRTTRRPSGGPSAEPA